MKATSCLNQICQRPVSRAFTLIELLIIVAMLGIMAAIIIPYYGESTDSARAEALATNITHIRTQIIRYSTDTNTVLTANGYPAAVANSWFRAGQLPDHAWSGRTIIVETVSGPSNHYYPAVKTFDPAAIGAASAWYNSSNGAFVARVPVQQTEPLTVALFNAVNKTDVTTIGQTTR